MGRNTGLIFKDSYKVIIREVNDLIKYGHFGCRVAGTNRWQYGDYSIDRWKYGEDIVLYICRKIDYQKYEVVCNCTGNFITFDVKDIYSYPNINGSGWEKLEITCNPYIKWYTFFNDLYKTLKTKKLI